jgi:hypothetical protein
VTTATMAMKAVALMAVVMTAAAVTANATAAVCSMIALMDISRVWIVTNKH